MNNANIIMIPVGKLVVDENYQRKINKTHVKNIINNFDWKKVDVIKVSDRDGNYFIYDGQHTATAIKALYGDNQLVPCNVQKGLTWEQEAKLFATQDNGVSKVSCVDKFRANYKAGDTEATDIVSVCEKYGIQVIRDSVYRSTFKTAAINTLTKYYRILGKELFEEGISLTASTWGGISESMSRKAFTAVFMFIKAYNGQYVRAHAINRWKKKTIGEIINAGDNSIFHGDSKYAKVLLSLYNSGYRPEERLIDKL